MAGLIDRNMKPDLIQRFFKKLQPQRERLLIVDDEEELRKLFSGFFEKRGYRVSTAESLEVAEAKLAEEAFDLILQDVMLGDGDGIEFLQRIKLLQPGVPVIILTGLGYDEPVLHEATENGAAGYMSKLLPLDQVLMEVHRVLKANAAGSSQDTAAKLEIAE
ncbi:MAG: response regulator GlrR [Verrucomicrobiales bacterium]|nr:response regulator GlrR [Verrucomicrobiales bacterium]